MTLRPNEKNFKDVVDRLRFKHPPEATKAELSSEFCHIKNLDYNNETEEETIERRRREIMQRDAYFLRTSPKKEIVFAVKYAETKNVGLEKGYNKQSTFLSKEYRKRLRCLDHYTSKLQHDLALIRTKNIPRISRRALENFGYETKEKESLEPDLELSAISSKSPGDREVLK